jgi:hypothetical protein
VDGGVGKPQGFLIQTEARDSWIPELGEGNTVLQYKRVFSTPRMRQACWLLIGFLAAYGTWTIIRRIDIFVLMRLV